MSDYSDHDQKEEIQGVLITMKKCPVCGVMMGDNVARCSMCKYDFQKASQGNTEEASAEAKQILEKKAQEKEKQFQTMNKIYEAKGGNYGN